MALPTPTPDHGDLYDIRVRFALGQSGWGETYRFATNGTATNLNVQDVGLEVVNARVPFLTNAGAVLRYTVVPVGVWDVDADPPRWRKPPDRGPVPIERGVNSRGQAEGDPFETNATLNMTFTAARGLYRRVAQFRGVPFASLRFNPDRATENVVVPGPVKAAADLFYKYISNTPGVTGAAPRFGKFVLRGRSHSPDTLWGDITDAGPDISGCDTVLTIDNTADLTGLGAGDRVHVHGVRGCLVGNLNGDATVVRVGALNEVTIDKKNCCCQPYALLPGGTLSAVEYDYYDTQPLEPGILLPMFVGRRKTGATREGGRGRRRKRCK